MLIDLKKAIIDWLFENPNEDQQISNCVNAFRRYIFDENGNYIIGGETVLAFIKNAKYLLY